VTRLRVISTLVAWLLLSIALWLSDADPSVFALAGIVAVAAAIGLVVFDLGTAGQTILWPRSPESKPARNRPAEPGRRWRLQTDPKSSLAVGELRTERIPRPLNDVYAAVRSHPTGLRARLVALVDDRLVTRHGVERRAAPASADDVLTPELRKLVASHWPDREPP
jgi:hypothetical protein